MCVFVCVCACLRVFVHCYLQYQVPRAGEHVQTRCVSRYLCCSRFVFEQNGKQTKFFLFMDKNECLLGKQEKIFHNLLRVLQATAQSALSRWLSMARMYGARWCQVHSCLI